MVVGEDDRDVVGVWRFGGHGRKYGVDDLRVVRSLPQPVAGDPADVDGLARWAGGAAWRKMVSTPPSKEASTVSEILVGVDGTAGAQDAMAFAKQLGRLTGARLRVATAFPYDDTPSRASNGDYRRALLEHAESVLAGIDAGDAPRHAVADVSPAHALHRLAAEHGVSLIVVGSTHRGAAGRVMPGSTGERLLHGSPCPVAIVPQGYGATEPLLRTIGIAYDGSEESEAALASACALARRVGATMRVIRIFDSSQVGTPALMTVPGYVSVHKELEQMQRRQLGERVASQPMDVAVETVFYAGSPNRELATQSESVDLMVMGSRGYGPLHAVLLGGVTHAVVRRAACPVIVMPRGAQSGLAALLAPTAEAVA
jgi:nucleotide-binding universal stress UspA family protein